MALGSASIFDDIQAGYWDDGLDAIIEIAIARRNFLRNAKGAENMVDFRPGTAVRVVNIRPKYLHGITGVVSPSTAGRRGDLMIDVDQHCWYKLGTRYGRKLSIPASSLEKL